MSNRKSRIDERNRLLEALKEIVDPISFMQARLKPDEKLDGFYATTLANDPGYLKSIARVALAKAKGE